MAREKMTYWEPSMIQQRKQNNDKIERKYGRGNSVCTIAGPSKENLGLNGLTGNRKTSLNRLTTLTILAILVQMTRQLTKDYEILDLDPVELEWNLDDFHDIPSDTVAYVAHCSISVYYPAGYTYPTSWSTLIDPIFKIKLNKMENYNEDFLDASDSFISIRSEVLLSSGYLYYRLALKLQDSSGIITYTYAYFTFSDFIINPLNFYLYVRTNPLTVTLIPSYEPNFRFRVPFHYEHGQKHEIDLKEAAQMKIGIILPYPDFNNFPYASIDYYKGTFITSTTPEADDFESKYRSEMETQYMMPKLPDVPDIFSTFIQVDLSPDADFNIDTTQNFLESISEFRGRKAVVQCVDDCKFVKNPTDQTYQLYLNGTGAMFKQNGFGTFPIFPGQQGESEWHYFNNRLFGRLTYSNLGWFKLVNEPGEQPCGRRYLMLNIGVHLTLDVFGRVYANDMETGLKVVPGRWYAIGVTGVRNTLNGKEQILSRIVLFDIEAGESTLAQIESGIQADFSYSQRFGGPECSAELFMKYIVSTKNYLALPEDGCPFVFYVLDPASNNWEKKCLFDELVEVPVALRYFDNDIKLNRISHHNCDRMKVNQAGVCSCSPGSQFEMDLESQEKFCKCLEDNHYYDWKRWKCLPCPINHIVKENGFECQKVEEDSVEFNYKYLEGNNQLKIMFKNSALPSDYIEEFDKDNLRSRFEIEIEGMMDETDYKWKLQFGPVEQKEAIIFINFEFISEMDYKSINVRLFSSKSRISPESVTLKTGPGNSKLSTFGSIAESISPESVQIAQESILLASVFLPSIFEKMPFILFLFSFLRTLNYYPVKIPENLHRFLAMFYIDYRKTYGYRIVNALVKMTYTVEEDYYLDPPKLKVKNRYEIYLSRVLYFSNTIPVISLVSKIGLVWYLVKVFRQIREATVTKISKIEQERKERGCFKRIKEFVFRKIITFMIVKIHIDIYGRLVSIFAAFGGFMEVMEYNKALCFVNIAEALLDFTVMVWIELKIYTFLKGSNAVQLLMLDVKRLKSVLMVDIFTQEENHTHSAAYLCLQNFCIFLLAMTLVVFQKFVEMLFLVHISIMLFLIAFCFLSKDKFKYKIDFFIYLSNNLGFCLIVIMFSFFMYYDEYEPQTVALYGFLVQIGIIVLIISKAVFLILKTIRMYKKWRESRKKNSLVKHFVKKSREKKKKEFLKKNHLAIGKKKGVRPPSSFDKLMRSSSKKKQSSGNSNSQLFRFVMAKKKSEANLGSLEELDKKFDSDDHMSQRKTGEIKRMMGSRDGSKMDGSKLMPTKLSVRLRRGSIMARSRRGSRRVNGKSSRSVMSISSKLKTVQPKSKLGIKLTTSRLKPKSKTNIPNLDSHCDLDKGETPKPRRERKKSSLKEIDDDLFTQLQQIHDEELRKRGTRKVEGIKVNSNGTFSSHSSDYYDENGNPEDLNSIIENTFKGDKNKKEETPKSIFSPLASPKMKPSKMKRGFSIAVNGMHHVSSNDLKKFAPSSGHLKEASELAKSEKIKIVRKPKVMGPRNSIMVSRKKRMNSSSLFGMKDRVNMRRGSLRLSLKNEAGDGLNPKQESYNELLSHRGGGRKHNTYAGQITRTAMNGEEQSSHRGLGIDRSPSPNRRNFLKGKHSTVKQSRFRKLDDDERFDSIVFEDS